jgi:hypothetical protein
MESRRVRVTALIIILICFFLPWIQVSCGATRETASGVDLARDGTYELWLIPLLMLAALIFGVVKAWKDQRVLVGLMNLVSGLVTAYLMNRERVKFEDGTGLIRVGLTGWFWLGLGSSVAIVVFAIYDLVVRRGRPSENT